MPTPQRSWLNRDRVSDLLLLCGLALILKGVQMIYLPAAVIGGGAALVVAALYALATGKKSETTG